MILSPPCNISQKKSYNTFIVPAAVSYFDIFEYDISNDVGNKFQNKNKMNKFKIYLSRLIKNVSVSRHLYARMKYL
jgi:hypothetical protein